MSEKNDLKNMFAPFMRWLPVLFPVLIIAGVITYRFCRYIVPIYETELRVKLETKDDSFTRNNLYKDFDVLTASDKVLTEVQVLKSHLIIFKTLKSMNLPVTYKRVGQLMNSEIYPEAPFIVVFDTINCPKKNTYYGLNISEDNSIELTFNDLVTNSTINEWTNFSGGRLQVVKNEKWLQENKNSELYGAFEFKINTLKGLKSEFVDDRLLVKAIDKDIDILRINFEGENPQKIADFTNQLVATFTNDYLETKVQAAKLTSNFIDSQIRDIKAKLVEAEANLERFRYDKKVLNSKQQLEIGLKKISQLDVQLANLALKKVTMDSLIVYVENDSGDYTKYAPSFESYGGLLFVELMKKHQFLLDERRRLSSEFTQNSRELLEVNEKLNQTRGYIKNSIINHRELVNYQYDLLNERVKFEKEKFTDLPSKERKFLVYEREFRQNEDIYNFLSKKKMEADIAKSVDLSFHKIIQVAHVPKVPTSPNKKFVTALVVLSVFLVSVFFIYLMNFLNNRVRSKTQIEKFFGHSVQTFLVKDSTSDYTFNNDMLTDVLEEAKGSKRIIAIASGYSGEGKSYFTRALTETQGSLKNSRTAVISNSFGEFSHAKNVEYEVLNKWRSSNYQSDFFSKDYDHVLIDTSDIRSSKEESIVLKHVDHVFFVLKTNKTKHIDLEFLKLFLKSNNIESYSLVLNDSNPFSNYQGEISISNQYKGKKVGVLKFFKYVKNWYGAWWSV